MRLDGRDVFFLTGTDEHGLKMAQTADREGLTPKALADRNAAAFQAMGKALNATNDDFIRTTEPRHYAASQAIWARMAANGDIYLSKYSGWYSVRDEAFFDESELTSGEGGKRFAPIWMARSVRHLPVLRTILAATSSSSTIPTMRTEFAIRKTSMKPATNG